MSDQQPAPQQSQQPKPKKRHLGCLITLSVIVVIILIVIIASCSSSSNTSSTPAAQSSSPVAQSEAASVAPTSSAAATKTVTYKVEGTGSANSISWLTINNGKSSQEQATNAALPWTKTITVPQNEWANFSSFTLTAQNGQSSGSIHATITVDGKVVADQTSTGQYAVVTANSNG